MSVNHGDPKGEVESDAAPHEPAPGPALHNASPETDGPVEAEVADEKSPQPDSLDKSPMKAADVNTLEKFIQFSYERQGKGLGTFRKAKLDSLEDVKSPENPSQDPVLELTRKLAAADLLIEVPVNVLLLLETQDPKLRVRNRIGRLMGQALAFHPAFQSPVLQATLTQSLKSHTRKETFKLFDAVEEILASNSKSMASLEHLKDNERKTLRLNAHRSLALYLSSKEAWEPDLQVDWHNKYLWQPETKKKDATHFWRILLGAKPADNRRTLAQLVKYFRNKEESAQQAHKDNVENVRKRAADEAKIAETRFAHERDGLVHEYDKALQEANDRTESLSQQMAKLTGDLVQSEQRSEQQKAEIEELKSEIGKRDQALEEEKSRGLAASVIAGDRYQQLRTRMMSMLENRSLLLDDALQATQNNKNEIAARRIEQSLGEFTKTIEELRSEGSADQ